MQIEATWKWNKSKHLFLYHFFYVLHKRFVLNVLHMCINVLWNYDLWIRYKSYTIWTLKFCSISMAVKIHPLYHTVIIYYLIQKLVVTCLLIQKSVFKFLGAPKGLDIFVQWCSRLHLFWCVTMLLRSRSRQIIQQYDVTKI